MGRCRGKQESCRGRTNCILCISPMSANYLALIGSLLKITLFLSRIFHPEHFTMSSIVAKKKSVSSREKKK